MTKNSIKAVVLTLFVVASSIHSFAQKIGHIHLDSLVSMMPESKKAKEEGQKFYKDQEAYVIGLQKELETKYQEYQQNEGTLPENIKQLKQKELQTINSSIQEAQQNAQTAIQKKNEELAKPVYEKAKKAIEQVAKENGFKYIIDTSSGIALYADANENVIALVKKKLGIVGLGSLAEEKKVEMPKAPAPTSPAPGKK